MLLLAAPACMFGAGPMPKLSPAVLPDNMLCRSAAGDKSMIGVEDNAIKRAHWQWLKRMSSEVTIGTTGAVKMEVDPTVYYEAFITGPQAMDLHAEVVDETGNVVVQGELNSNTVDLHWNSTQQSHWMLRWGYNKASIASACIYMLAVATKK